MAGWLASEGSFKWTGYDDDVGCGGIKTVPYVIRIIVTTFLKSVTGTSYSLADCSLQL